MKKIKKYIIWIFVGIATAFGLFTWISKIFSKKKTAKIDKQIDDNNKVIHNAQGHIDAIQDQKEDVKDSIDTREETIEDLKDQAEQVQPETPTTVSEAKENIINKTKRRGRKPKNKKS